MCGAAGTEKPVTDAMSINDAVLHEKIRKLLNENSRENVSNTPDFILATVMMNELIRFEVAVNARDKWYGCGHKIGGGI